MGALTTVPDVRAVTLTGYPEVSTLVGLDPYEMLRAAGISPATITDPENRISARSVCKLLEDSALASGSETFGLAMAECRSFASLGPVALLLEHLGGVREVVEALTEYRRHLNDIVILGIEEARGEHVLRVELMAKFATPQAADLAIGVAHVALTGASRLRWRPFAVHLTRSAPRDRGPHRRFFGSSVEFGSAFNGFICPIGPMEGWPWADCDMAAHARRLLKLVPFAPETAPVCESVKRIISLLLPVGRASLANVAAHLGKSPRSLQRALAAEGRQFGDLLNEVRRHLVVQHLSNRANSITWVGAMLGFFSSSSFSRWFATEFGVPPRIWRSEHSRAVATNLF
ncbi:MAG TPA: AraC family transcriptional regulator ligand-binding domain-containing protein [Sphingomicrobium sp.]|nr:AraC family transcriptional regulator ligand-binding domain-containing protein [Sphingomicrobium sp.]